MENIQGVSENIIEQHAYFASYALVALITVGVIALIGIYFKISKSTFAKPLATVTLFLALISFGLIARTGYLGGQIRHTEIVSGSLQTAGEQGGEQEGDDD